MKRAQPAPGSRPDYLWVSPEGTVMTAAETERYLLQNLEEEKESPRHALLELAMFYKDTEQ